MRPVTRNTLVRLVLIASVLFCSIVLYHPVYGQTTVRLFNPTPVTVELSGKEPPSPDIAASYELAYSGGGGCGSWEWWCALQDIFGPDKINVITAIPPFVNIADHIVVTNPGDAPNNAASITVCGYTDDVQPVATLTMPSGKTETVASLPYADNTPSIKIGDKSCWNFPVRLGLGAELGTYKITLAHSDGNIDQTWTEGTEYCPKAQWVGNTTNQVLFTGYEAGEKLRVSFYAVSATRDDPNNPGFPITTYGYVASRDVQIDDVGTLLMTINKARSADFSDNIQYKITTVDPLPAAKYPNYEVVGYYCGWQTDSDFPASAQVTPTSTGTIPIYASFNDTSSVSFELNSGEPVLINESKVVGTDAGAVFWNRIQTEDGREGWTAGRTLLDTNPIKIPGAQAYTYTDTPLYATPDETGSQIATLAPKTVLTLVQERIVPDSVGNQISYWYVQSANGNGWVRGDYVTPFPWKSVSVEGISVP